MFMKPAKIIVNEKLKDEMANEVYKTVSEDITIPPSEYFQTIANEKNQKISSVYRKLPKNKRVSVG